MSTIKTTRNLLVVFLMGVGVIGFLNSTSCDSGSSTDGGGGGGNREFASGNLAGNGASFSHAFMTAKVVPYYCAIHGGAGGSGMSGVITVNAGGSPSRHNVSITSSTLPDLIIDVIDTVVWTNNSGMIHTVQSDN